MSAIPQLETTSILVIQAVGTSSDCSTVPCGNFAEMMLGARQGIVIGVLPQPYASTYQIALVIG